MSEIFFGAYCDGGTHCPSWHKLKSHFEYIGTPYCTVLCTVYTVPPHAVHVQTVIDMVLPSRSLTANSVPCTITQQYQLPTSRCLSRLSQIWLRMPWACQPVGHSHQQTQNQPHKVLSPIQVTSLCLSCISHLFTSLALCALEITLLTLLPNSKPP